MKLSKNFLVDKIRIRDKIRNFKCLRRDFLGKARLGPPATSTSEIAIHQQRHYPLNPKRPKKTRESLSDD